MNRAVDAPASPPATMLEWALRHAADGFRVLPLIENGKVPDLKDWPNKASRDPEQIRKWWAPNADGTPSRRNIGLAMGGEFFAVDPDVSETKGNGPDQYDALRLAWDFWTPTRRHRTPGGGWHYVYRKPADILIKTDSGTLDKAVDTRGEGGQIVAPGSIINGVAYAIVDALPPAEACPELLAAARKAPAPEKRDVTLTGKGKALALVQAIDHARTVQPSILKSHGHKQLMQTVMRLHDFGLNADETFGVIMSEFNPRCSPPWDLPELEKQVYSMHKSAGHGLGNASAVAAFEAIPEPEPSDPAALAPTPWRWVDPRAIPPRAFLYGKHYIRKFVSAGFGAPGGGKSSKRIAEAVAMASGRPLLGVTPVQKLKVWYWNGEDPAEETTRRVAALCLHYGIDLGELEGFLFTDSGRDMPIIIAEQDRTGTKIAVPVVEGLKAGIKAAGIDVLILDPFVSCHRVAENDNAAIDAVVKKFADIANATECSVNLEHHLRKTNGSEATVEDGRGAISLVGAARSVEVLNKMTAAEAARLGVEQNWRYFSVDHGKANMSPLRDREWFKLESVFLDNGNALHAGDNVGVATKWAPPSLTEGITDSDFDRCATTIRAGKWREDSRAQDWIGKPIAATLGLDLTSPAARMKTRAVVDSWIEEGKLALVQGVDDRRRPRSFVEIAEKAAIS